MEAAQKGFGSDGRQDNSLSSTALLLLLPEVLLEEKLLVSLKASHP